MRWLVVVVCLLVLVSAAVVSAQLSPTELIELENILKEYETVEQLLNEGLTQLSAGQIALAQGLIALHEGIGVLFQQTHALELSLTRIQDATKAQQRRTRQTILILAGVIVAETAAVIIFR